MADIKKIRRRIQYTLVYRLVQFFIFVSNAIPRRAWLSFCGGLGTLVYYMMGKTRNDALKSLAVAFPEKTEAELSALCKSFFKMLGKNGGDIIRATKIDSLPAMEKFLVTHGYENFEKANSRAKGIIFLASHVGAFDLMVTNFALRGFNPHVIGTPLKDPRLNDLLWGYRNRYGAEAIQRGKETFRMLKVLKSAGYVALLIDQDTNVKSRFVNFFGKPAATPVGASILAMKTGAAVVPVYIHLAPDGLQHMRFLPEIPMQVTGDDEVDMVENTQRMTTVIEQQIRQHPEQWVWMHQRWKTQPGDEVR